MSVINLHRIDLTNVGDKYSSPTRYFPFPKETKVVEIESITEKRDFSDDVLVVGGGGLISHFFEENLEHIFASNPKKLILWGCGNNFHDASPKEKKLVADYQMGNFDIVGTRDFPSKFDWVPCVTCMDDLFDKEYAVINDIVIYEMVRRPLDDITGYPKMSSSSDLSIVIPFLGSAKTVVTNTYHGAYWATLLNKKVIVVNAFSSKFYSMKHKHPLVSTKNWKEYLDKTTSYPDALVESRNANRTFYEKIKKDLFE